jgi:hypothetical protein
MVKLSDNYDGAEAHAALHPSDIAQASCSALPLAAAVNANGVTQ